MSEHNTKTNTVETLPDSVKITQAIAIVDDLLTEVKFLTKLHKEIASSIRSTTERVNKLRQLLEAK